MNEQLYHGTDEFSQIDIVKNGINLYCNLSVGDFGNGFYLTPNLQCAKEMALRKAFLNTKPSIVEVILKENFFEIVNVKDFGNLNRDSENKDIFAWAQFIINNRNGIDYINKVSAKYGLGNHNLDKRYDIIIGTIADGRVTQIAKKCKADNRLITSLEAGKLLEKEYGLQYCIGTEKGVSVIEGHPKKKGVSWR